VSGSPFVVNVEAAVTRRGEYLVVERAATEDHAPGQQSLVGGTVDADPPEEAPIRATVHRELREEVGVEVGALAYVTSGYFVDDGGTPVINLVFLGRWVAGDPRPRDPDEVAAIKWIPGDEAARLKSLPPWTRRYIRAAEDRRQALGW
jgi:8-oxo-dGTP diphosphatase